MGVECVRSNPTSCQFDGELSLSITGGTPPYTITWTSPNGDFLGNSLELVNLSPGHYISTVIDYYNDFTVVTNCVLIAPRPSKKTIHIISTEGDIINNITFNGEQIILFNNDIYPLMPYIHYSGSMLTGHYTISVDVSYFSELPACIGVGGQNKTLTYSGIYTFYNVCLTSDLYIALFVPDSAYYPCS